MESSQCLQNNAEQLSGRSHPPPPTSPTHSFHARRLNPVQRLFFFFFLISASPLPTQNVLFLHPQGWTQMSALPWSLPDPSGQKLPAHRPCPLNRSETWEMQAPEPDGPNPLTSFVACGKLQNHPVPEFSNTNFGRVLLLTSQRLWRD